MTEETLSRREILAALALAGLTSCERNPPAPPSPPEPSFPLSTIPVGRRVTVRLRGRPVEVLRTSDGVTARLLACPHQGCEVAWDEAERVYACPCHQGRFAPDGSVLSGPATRPLMTLATRTAGGRLLVTE